MTRHDPVADSPLDHAVAARDSATLRMVEEAVHHRQVLLAFQPIAVAAEPGRTAFWEGLARVLDETGRIIPARDFIHAIEETETGRLIDCVALEKGLAALARVPDLRLAVNMSARSIGFPRWRATLDRALRRDARLGERLILEITEQSAMLMPEIVASFMADQQRRGVAFALDNFGAGATALRHFKHFTFDVLKIDGQFVRGVEADADNQVLTGAIVAIARQFDMLTVAQQVERPAEADTLRALGVDCLQGHHVAAATTRPPWAERPRETG
ncbi:EAL domain-containing protein [Rhodosalinus sediminis]|uniref:EAL domain-containing protein n=1 Tax=Rhodosalinus sediminis TaxID=1940533 RepID=UPI0023564CC6|nr:EAL domain-containing protein [Rhodosalinus sediminis]